MAEPINNEGVKIVTPKGGETIKVSKTNTASDTNSHYEDTNDDNQHNQHNQHNDNSDNNNSDKKIIPNGITNSNPAVGLSEIKTSTLDKFTRNILESKFQDLSGVYVKDGNYVNEKGEVVFSKDDVKSELDTIDSKYQEAFKTSIVTDTPIEIELDGVTKASVVNENGDLIGEDGQVLLTKDKLYSHIKDNYDVEDIMSIGEEEEALIDQVSKLSGYEAYDESGNILEFEDNIQGLAKREAYIINQESTRLANEKLNNFINRYPDLEDVINYVTINNSLEGYAPGKSYDNIAIDPVNSEQNFQLVVEAEVSRGRTEAEAKKLAAMFKDNNLLPDMAKTSLEYLKNNSKKIRDNRRQEALEAEQIKETERVESIKKISQLVNNGKLLDFNIPENIKIKDKNGIFRTVPKQAFVDFVTKPVKDGITADELMQSNESMENRLFISYLRFTGLDIKNLVNSMVGSKTVESYKNKKSLLRLGSTSKPTTTGNSKPISPIRR